MQSSGQTIQFHNRLKFNCFHNIAKCNLGIMSVHCGNQFHTTQTLKMKLIPLHRCQQYRD